MGCIFWKWYWDGSPNTRDQLRYWCTANRIAPQLQQWWQNIPTPVCKTRQRWAFGARGRWRAPFLWWPCPADIWPSGRCSECSVLFKRKMRFYILWWRAQNARTGQHFSNRNVAPVLPWSQLIVIIFDFCLQVFTFIVFHIISNKLCNIHFDILQTITILMFSL